MLAKDEVRKSKTKTVDLIVRLLKMDKEAAAETYDVFLTTLSSSGVPNRVGIDNLVRSLQAQGRFTDRKNSSPMSPTIVWRPKWLKSWVINCRRGQRPCGDRPVGADLRVRPPKGQPHQVAPTE